MRERSLMFALFFSPSTTDTITVTFFSSRTHKRTRAHTQRHTYRHTRAHIDTHTQIHTHTSTYRRTHTNSYAHTHTQIRTHTLSHTHVQTHEFTRAQTRNTRVRVGFARPCTCTRAHKQTHVFGDGVLMRSRFTTRRDPLKVVCGGRYCRLE